jgi:nicotinamide mononucleotide transporter
MDVIQVIEIFAFVTGIAYVVLEILQKNAMWVLGILTGAACAYSFAVQRSWGMTGLNLYYVVISVIGLIQWRKDGAVVGEDVVHLRELPRKTALWSAVGFVLGSLALIWVFRALGDRASALDATATVLSIIATWWLTRSYIQQWMLWVVANTLTMALCIANGQYWMMALYFAYAVSAVYGYFHWKQHGVIID